MEDITGYSNQELSLRVFNDEYLYSCRHSTDLVSLLDYYYTYTSDQMSELNTDLSDDSE